AIATLRNSAGGALGSARNPAGVNPNITAGGGVVGTSLGPSPAATHASGRYHFKPSCYGYLNLASINAGIARVQTGPETAKIKNPSLTLPVASTAGTLLVATVNSDPTAAAFTAPAGWVSAVSINQATAGRVEIWYYPNNPGGITSATFTTGGNAVGQLSEWSGVFVGSPLVP